MLGSTTSSVHLLVTSRSLAASSSQQPPCPSSSVLFLVKPRSRRSQKRWFVPLGFVIGGGGGGGGGREGRCGLLGFHRGLHYGWSTGVVRRCRDWDGEGDFALEAEILEFMKCSEKPEAFPSRKELVDAGRMDLAEAIVKQGGWMSMGWDLEEEEEAQENEDFDSGSVSAMELDDFRNKNDWSSEEDDEVQASDSLVSSCPYDYSSTASSSGRSLEIANTNAEHETGIEGILSRLEKERSFTFGLGLAENEDGTFSTSNNGKDDWHAKFSSDATVGGFTGSSRSSSLSPKKAVIDESGCRFNQNKSFSDFDGSRNSHKPETWRAWSSQRAGSSDIGSEVMEISSSETSVEGLADIPIDEKLSDSDPNERNELGLHHELIDHNQLRSRLKHLEFELSSVLKAVRSNADETASHKDDESSSDDLQILSDAWEFQENEIMNAHDKLRSIRAKIAVFEGKMALTIIDAQKIMEEKQKRIDGARRASRLLRPTCIVWPNSASEVLLAGSFDGWATQRKMGKSSTGIFSLWLQLYPGRYEIKFIVDGEWRVDPLRPIVTNNGHQNNLLIIT